MTGRIAIILAVLLSFLLTAAMATAAPVSVQNLTTFRGSGDETVWPNAAWPWSPPVRVSDRLFGATVGSGVYSMPLYPSQYEVPGAFSDTFGHGLHTSASMVWDEETQSFYGVARRNSFADSAGFLFRAEFDGANPSKVLDLARPNGVLIRKERVLYGLDRGPEDHGRLFAINLDRHDPVLETVHEFGAPPVGISQTPNGMILGSDGWLYGLLAYARGVPYMEGTPIDPDTPTGAVYRLNPESSASGFEILHTFTLEEGEIPWHDCIGEGCAPVDAGEGPDAISCNHALCFSKGKNNVLAWLVEGPDGFLYGGTTVGNCQARTTKPDPTQWDAVVSLPLCVGIDGEYIPEYGSPLRGTPPYYGGPNWHGSLYRLQKDGSDFSLLHTFSGTDGSQPRGPMAVGSDGNIYGTTLGGGQSGIPQSADYDPAYPDAVENNYDGTLYRLNLSQIAVDESGEVQQSGFEMLHSFSRAIDGTVPVGLTGAGGSDVYGATNNNGERYINRVGKEMAGQGTVFKVSLDPDAPQASVTVTLSSGDIQSGDTARLIWTSQYADSCTASGGADGDHWNGPRDPEGYQDITPPPGTYYYTLTCESTLTGGQVGDVASLGVGAPDRTTDGNTVEYGNGAGGSSGGAVLLLLAVLGMCRRILRPRKPRLPWSASHAC